MCENTAAPMRASLASLLGVLALLGASCTNKVIKQTQPAGEGLPGGPRPSEPCKSGDQTFGIDAFDVTPSEDAGSVCDVGNVLDEDGSVAGASAASGGGKGDLVGFDVNGCVGVEFGEGIVLSSALLHMRPLSGSCGHSCTEGDDGCGTGWKVRVYAGPSLDAIRHVQQVSLTTKDIKEYRLSIASEFEARFVVVCREATPDTGDDLGIDAISGFCQ
jgi:hypothetical protein